ncbi:MAG TPA: hypothetical protein VF868_04585 [Bacteroidia bacterium]
MRKFILFTSAMMMSGLIIAGPVSKKFQLKPLENKSNSIFRNTVKEGDDDGIKNKAIITAGAGFNLFAASLTLKYAVRSNNFNYYYNINTVQASPIFNFNLDYGLLKNFSVGAGFGFQGARVGITGYDGASGNNYNYEHLWKRYYFAVRGDYYIVANENISLYTGLRLGYNLYSVKSTGRTVEPNLTASYFNLSPAIVHAHFGFSYFIKGIVGINAEVGIGYGGPFIPAVGVTVKL